MTALLLSDIVILMSPLQLEQTHLLVRLSTSLLNYWLRNLPARGKHSWWMVFMVFSWNAFIGNEPGLIQRCGLSLFILCFFFWMQVTFCARPRTGLFEGLAEDTYPNRLISCCSSDLWGLGCIIYQLVAGLPPFRAGWVNFQTCKTAFCFKQMFLIVCFHSLVFINC